MSDFETKIDSMLENVESNRVSDLDRSPFRLIKSLLLRVKDVNTSAEARQAINEAMNIAYYGVKNRDHILVFGDSLKNDEEDLSDYDYLNRIISNYSEFDIKNLYGLSLDEFSNKTVYEQNILIKNALKLMEIKAKREDEMLQDMKEKESRLSGSLDGIGEYDDH